MNRRRFLATSGISLAGAALWGCVTEDRPVLAPGVGKSATKSIVPTAKGAVRSKAVTLVSHDAQDLALHWSGNTLPTKGIRMEQPGLTWPAAAPIGGTVVGVTGLQASHGDLLAYWVHAKHALPFGVWQANVAGTELATSAPVRQRIFAPAGQVRLQWQLGSAGKREVVFGGDLPLTRGLYAVSLLPDAGEASPLLWVCLDTTVEALHVVSAS